MSGGPFSCNPCVLFDFDDTLVCEEHWVVTRWKQTAAHVEAKWGIRGFARALSDVLCEKGFHGERLADRALERLGYNNERANEIVEHYLLEECDERLTQGALESLDYLKKQAYRLGIVTNGRETQKQRVRRARLDSYFDAVVCAYGANKPAPQAFLECLELLGGKPAGAVFVGNDADKDCAGAAAVGMTTVLVGAGPRGACADYQIRSLRELPALFRLKMIHS